jgi:cytochrome d ubiquinol oxidase subunit I
MDAEFLSRVQFALTASFHFIFPPLSMGLGLMLVIIGIIYVRTKDRSGGDCRSSGSRSTA